MAGPIFSTDPEDAVLSVALEGLTALFHHRSGMTHILAPPAPEILTLLRSAPATEEELRARLEERFEVGDPGALGERLAELEASGLISRS